ncbi:hypothetical protein FRC20_005097 [Serendipita sp. 405]|nr:hypothetical protein FRC15_006882 [Serendipita sp. 397]KAG8841328.1 hypothetical protein FRC20_005097 [Serendipita sp. 405]
MLKHSFFIAICLLSHILVLAYQITTPSDRDEIEHAAWTTNGPNDIKWERVTTDPETVTVVLVNEDRSILPTNNLVLVENVDGSLLHVAISASAGTEFPVGNGFRVNFVKSKEDVNTIYAQSSQFRIIKGGPNASSGSSELTAQGDLTKTTLIPRTTYVAPAETVTVTASANSSRRPKTTFSCISFLGVLFMVPILA